MKEKQGNGRDSSKVMNFLETLSQSKIVTENFFPNIQRTGIKPMTLIYWVTLGWISPSLTQGAWRTTISLNLSPTSDHYLIFSIGQGAKLFVFQNITLCRCEI